MNTRHPMSGFVQLATLFTILHSLPATAAGNSAAKDEPSLGRVVCNIDALTMCKDHFCTYLPGDDGVKVFFDFDNRTYINPAVSEKSKPMENVAVDSKGGWYQVKFSIEMPHGRGNVTFNKTAPVGGPSKMSAANVYSYPDDPGTIITGMRCRT